jgi:hypothetical protein
MWFCGNVNPFAPKMVGLLQANPFGLHDMHGNLWELVNDLYTPDLGSNPVTDPTGPSSNSNGDIVFRGGGAEVWLNRSASRLGGSPNIAENDETGFRVATTSLAAGPIQINAGMSDAWSNPDTSGQGFFITVFPDIQYMFLAWFTFDTERPDESVSAILGEPGHRWLVAEGKYADNQAVLDAYYAVGGLFDTTPTPELERIVVGTMIVEFTDCSAGTITYDYDIPPDINLQGVVPIQRVWAANAELCEALQDQLLQE